MGNLARHIEALNSAGYITVIGPELRGITDQQLVRALSIRAANRRRNAGLPDHLHHLSPEAAKVASHLETTGTPISRSRIRSDVFSRNCPPGMLDRVQGELHATGRLIIESRRLGNGRPTELWSLLPDDPWAPNQAPTAPWATKPQIP